MCNKVAMLALSTIKDDQRTTEDQSFLEGRQMVDTNQTKGRRRLDKRQTSRQSRQKVEKVDNK